MSMSEERMSVSEIDEQDQMESELDESESEFEEDDQLDENLDAFAARRRSQLFVQKRLPQSKSDGHLLSNTASPQRRPRTPCFDESLNVEEEPVAFIRHSATYSGQVQGKRLLQVLILC